MRDPAHESLASGPLWVRQRSIIFTDLYEKCAIPRGTDWPARCGRIDHEKRENPPPPGKSGEGAN